MRSPMISAALLAAALLLPAVPAFAQTAAPATATSPASTSEMAAPSAMSTAPHAAKKSAAKKDDGTSIVNINSATGPELDALPQIGPKRTAKIIAGRPYKSVDELVTKKVLSQKLFDKLKPRLTA